MDNQRCAAATIYVQVHTARTVTSGLITLWNLFSDGDNDSDSDTDADADTDRPGREP
eukprot:SAG31_NODE_390_length_16345_cov_12.811523_15_plen_57_part_00